MRRDAGPGALSGRPGLREQKRAETRSALASAALRLFAEKGFRATSVDEIAAAARVSRSTFFRYFGSKEAALFDQADRSGEVFLRKLAGRPSSEGSIAAFEEALVALAEEVAGDEARASSRLREELFRGDPALSLRRAAELERWRSMIADAFAARRGETAARGADLIAAAVCIATTEQIGERWRGHERGLDPVQAVRRGFAELRALLDP